MPKIRGVKPDYWTHDEIVELSIPARLLFVGMWNFACDNGHLRNKPGQIKRRILPEDDLSIASLLDELEGHQRIIIDGDWITVPNLAHHQKPDKRYWQKCDKPGCDVPEETVSQRNARRAHGVQTSGALGVHGGRTVVAHVDGDGDGDVKVIVNPAPEVKRPTKRKTRLPDDFKPTDAHSKYVTENGIDGGVQLAKFRDHHAAKGSTMLDWNAAFSLWLRNSLNYDPPKLRPVSDPSQLPPVEDSWMKRRPAQ